MEEIVDYKKCINEVLLTIPYLESLTINIVDYDSFKRAIKLISQTSFIPFGASDDIKGMENIYLVGGKRVVITCKESKYNG